MRVCKDCVFLEGGLRCPKWTWKESSGIIRRTDDDSQAELFLFNVKGVFSCECFEKAPEASIRAAEAIWKTFATEPMQKEKAISVWSGIIRECYPDEEEP